jgi:formate hydrogenlyase subunit 3/multisubunit Na+/H+ antiporter MnhD subunit
MIVPSWLLSLPILFPLAFAILSLLVPASTLPRLGKNGAVLTTISVVPCLQWLLRVGPVYQSPGGWTAPLGIDLYLDGYSSLLLLFSSLTGLCISFYAANYFRPAADGSRSRTDFFWPLWFVTWGGIHSLFLTLDLFNIYVTLELISVSSVGLILIADTPRAIRAALQYQMQALVAGLIYLLGVGLIYNSLGTLDLQQIAGSLAPGPMPNTGMALMVAGLLIKSALFPMHFWLPRAHADAPAPVSAVLSGLVVTVAFVIMTRIWFSGLFQLAPLLLPRLLGVLGGTGIIWGGFLALRQNRLKRILAYSTVSQMGYLFLVFALNFENPAGRGLAWTGAVYLAISLGFSKAAAFLVAGYLRKAEGSDHLDDLRGAGRHHPVALFVFTLAAVNLMALPPSSGFIGKWLLFKAFIYSQQWGIALVMLGGVLLSAVYLFRVFEALLGKGKSANEIPRNAFSRTMLVPALILALATLIPVLFITAPETLLRIGTPFEFSRFLSFNP